MKKRDRIIFDLNYCRDALKKLTIPQNIKSCEEEIKRLEDELSKMKTDRVEVKVKSINVFQKEVENITTFSKLDYCLTYASNIFLYDDVIEITI